MWLVFHSAVGLCSSHPYAIQALQRSAHTDISLLKINEIGSTLFQALQLNVPYLRDATLELSPIDSINTHFHVDHTAVLTMMEQLKQRNEWWLGELPDGYEYFAVVQRQ